MVTNYQFWKSKRVLVTGHTGFKGAWLSSILASWGSNVKGISLEPPTKINLFSELGISGSIDHQILDIRNFSELKKSIVAFNPEIVLHLAAQPLVRYSYDFPLETYETNVMGTANVLEALRSVPAVKSIVVVTTDKCYENKEWDWGYRENDPMGGYDPYSSSKGCAELVTAAYRQSFFQKRPDVGLASARAGNVIGGGDWALDRLVPDLIQALDEGRKVEIRSPQSVRPWQHVLEPIGGYLLLAEKLYEQPQKFSQGYNFGPEDSGCVTVEVIADTVCNLWGKPHFWTNTSVANVHEAKLLKLDISKVRNQLKWAPKWDISTTLKNTVDWYKQFYDKQNVKSLTSLQIANYFGIN
tara:strand:+ start:59541 stop:60605 length:1065 start_codon:yes stop_codon:yes gene_type:complete